MSVDETGARPLVILGGGPGGYPVAFAAADAGRDVIIVDEGVRLGGTCLNDGCIPSKALLHVARVINEARLCERSGIGFSPPEIDLERLRQWKQEVIAGLGGGLEQLASARQVRWIRGAGRLTGAHELEVVSGPETVQRLCFEHLVIATGSTAICPPALRVDSPLVMDSTQALKLEEIPGRLLVIGGGYVGLELGTVFAALGSEVEVVEMESGLLPGVDRDLVKPLTRALESAFSAIHLNTQVTSLEPGDGAVTATWTGDEGVVGIGRYDRVLVAVGRRPNSSGLGLEGLGVEFGPVGEVVVDSAGRTACPSVLAVGDVCGGVMLAHKAAGEARNVVHTVLGRENVTADSAVIPAVVFTDPEVAWCGLTETAARASGRAVRVTRVPWMSSGRAHAMHATDGLTKVIVDADSGEVVGAGVVGAGAGELIGEASLAITRKLSPAEWSRAMHPHPTMSETWCEACEHACGNAVHLLPRRQRHSR